MLLFTKENLKQIPSIGKTSEESNPIVWVKLFDPFSQWTWYVIEYDGKDLCFGYVQGIEAELGYFTLHELTELAYPHIVERDRYFKPCLLSELTGNESSAKED